MGTADSITIEISAGELVDRLTIAQVKFERLRRDHEATRVRALARNIHYMKTLWCEWMQRAEGADDLIALLCCEEWLFDIHSRLWNFEESVRSTRLDDKELLQRYTKITAYNDVRARIKKHVDMLVTIFSAPAEIKAHDFDGEINPDVFLGAVSSEFTNGICITV